MIPSPAPLYCRNCGAANPAGSSVCFACQRVLDALEENENAQPQDVLLLQRYRILAQLGTGGFGAVYKVMDISQADAIVAIKQINLQGLKPQEIIEATDAFHREVRLLSGLKHPNLPTIHDSFTDPDHWYIVMDFIEGETLEDYLKQRFSVSQQPGLPLIEVLALGLQLCTVLDYLHTRHPPIIFRDLKPSNIMYTPAGQLYLIDFGIARHYIPGKPKDTIPFGSPGYAAPEQYGKAQTTPQADIYSLGALLHQLLSGDDPADSPFHFAPLRLYGSPELAKLEELIQQMVMVDASKRPDSAAGVKELLQRLHDAQDRAEPRLWRPPEAPLPLPEKYTGYGTWSATTGTGQQQQQVNVILKRLSRRKIIVRSLTLGATAVVGVSVLGVCSFFARPHFSGVMANPYFTPPPVPASYLVFSRHSAAVTTLAWSPDGTQIASGSADKTVLVWRAADGALLYTFKGYTSPLTSVVWSFDNMCIASCGESDGSVQVWEAINGDHTTSFQEHHGRALALSWSRLKEFIASGGEDKTVQIWNADNGKHSLTYQGHTGSVRYVAWSPVGLMLASASSDKTVRIWKDSSRSAIPVYRGHSAGVNALAWSPDATRIASASDDGTVQVWNIADGSPVVTYRGHTGSVYAVAWLSEYNGAMAQIVSGGADKTVQVWDITGTHIATYNQHTAPVRALATFSGPSGKRIASASDDSTVHLWTPPV
mgnify:CR=1 FL=1